MFLFSDSMAKQIFLSKKYLGYRNQLSKEFNRRGQFDLVDFKLYKTENYKCIRIYKNQLTFILTFLTLYFVRQNRNHFRFY